MTELPAYGRDERKRLLDMLMALINSDMFRAARSVAFEAFVGSTFDNAPQAALEAALENGQTQIAFNSWFMFDAVITEDGHTLIDVVRDMPAASLTAGQSRYLDRMAASAMRLYEIRDVEIDKGLTLRDLWNDKDVWVSEKLATHSAQKHMLLATRVVDGSRGTPELDGAALVFSQLDGRELLAELRRDRRRFARRYPASNETAFFKSTAPRIHHAWLQLFARPLPVMVTSEGDVMRVQELHFDISDEPAVVAALESHPNFTRSDDGSFEWLDAPGTGFSLGGGDVSRRILGSLTLKRGKLVATVMSDKRAARLQRILAASAGSLMRYRLTEIHDIKKTLTSGARHAGGPASASLGPDEQKRLLDEFNARYYRDWVDKPVPLLGGRTPRHAAQLKTMRPKLIALLKDIETRPAVGGNSVPDLSWIWDELGLAKER